VVHALDAFLKAAWPIVHIDTAQAAILFIAYKVPQLRQQDNASDAFDCAVSLATTDF
jgi:hypothetical protein